jgi:hypothetical protein
MRTQWIFPFSAAFDFVRPTLAWNNTEKAFA